MQQKKERKSFPLIFKIKSMTMASLSTAFRQSVWNLNSILILIDMRKRHLFQPKPIYEI